MRRRPVTSLLAAAAAGCLSIGLLVVPASAAPREIQYYALGDSYTFGVGNDSHSYFNKLDVKKTIDGVKLAYPLDGTAVTTLGQVTSVSRDADLVTITVGGNDVGWVQTLEVCAASSAACPTAIDAAMRELPALADHLKTLFASLNAASGAKVVVLGYPHLVTVTDPTSQMTPAYLAINQATDALNAVIASEAREARFEFVDVTERFEGHGANTNNPWINPYPAVSAAAVPLHPNAKGQQAYYAAVRSTGNLG